MEIKELKPDRILNLGKNICVFMQVSSNLLVNLGLLGIAKYMQFPININDIATQALSNIKRHPEMMLFMIIYNIVVIPLIIKLNHREIFKDNDGNIVVINT